ncbi:hsp90 co-chaperone Cdc37-like [Schistocerca nitens]|uniref:hsp90 co-chaperone Cdc37-like n=1 Tax=Schistocerca nitens TaxID=7011 RepID=UPI002118B487|nr:hsp90 co-chaperone Cdc37-like [Schistocerca nitens]
MGKEFEKLKDDVKEPFKETELGLKEKQKKFEERVEEKQNGLNKDVGAQAKECEQRKTEIAEGEDKKAFDNEPHSSIDEIHSRAAVKLKVALAEADEEELNVVAYSKWKDTEISDVEDDTHPYIDTSSLFRWRHQARIERMEEQRRCKKETEKEHIVQYEKFVKNSEMLRRYNDSKRFLTRQPEHESEHTANYLVIWCIHFEMEEKHDLMNHVSHLRICIQYIQERHKKSIFFASYVLPTKADNVQDIKIRT